MCAVAGPRRGIREGREKRNDEEKWSGLAFGDSTMHFVGGLALWLGSYGLCQVRR